MAAYSARRSSGPVLQSFSNTTTTTTTTTTARTTQRATYPSYNFYMTRPGSGSGSVSVSTRVDRTSTATPKRSCMCSPTNHPGSFRCSLHKAAGSSGATDRSVVSKKTVSCGSSSRLNMRRSAMKNSLVRIGTVEREMVKRALAALIRPSSHNQRRRGDFRPRGGSRLSIMTMA